MDDEREQQKIVSEREREKRESESSAKKMENAGNNEKLKKFSVMRQYDGDDGGGGAAVAAGRAAVAQNLYIDTQTKKNCKQFKLNDFELHNSGTFEFNLHFALMK